jgi:kynurenine formamidase
MRRRLGIVIAAALVGAVGAPVFAQALDPRAWQIVDLSHPYNERTIYWPTSPSRFQKTELAHGHTPAGYFYAAYAVCTPEHGGTHLDAPIHFAEGGWTTEEVPLDRLVAPAVVLDVSSQASRDRDYRVSAADVEEFERRHGRIAAGTMVLVRTGWSRHWPHVKAYLGDDTPGDASRLSFPGFGLDAARLLVEERGVTVLGIDTASLDYGRSTDFTVHRFAMAKNVAGLENLTNLEHLPPTGSVVVALPMKIEGGSGGPLRAIALLPR